MKATLRGLERLLRMALSGTLPVSLTRDAHPAHLDTLALNPPCLPALLISL